MITGADFAAEARVPLRICEFRLERIRGSGGRMAAGANESAVERQPLNRNGPRACVLGT